MGNPCFEQAISNRSRNVRAGFPGTARQGKCEIQRERKIPKLTPLTEGRSRWRRLRFVFGFAALFPGFFLQISEVVRVGNFGHFLRAFGLVNFDPQLGHFLFQLFLARFHLDGHLNP